MHRKLIFRSLLVIFAILAMYGKIDIVQAQNPKKDKVNNAITSLLAHDHVEGEIIVKFKSHVSTDDAMLKHISEKTHASINALVKRRFKGIRGLELVKLSENKSMKQALEFYLNNPDIEYAEPNYIVHATLTPNDPDFTNLWGLHNTGQSSGTNDADIDAPEAWNISFGTNSVIIAVVDSGVAYDHPDLIDNIWINTGETSCTDGLDNDSNGYHDDCYGWDFYDNDNDPMDFLDHGTHVAGTIAAAGNNAQGVTGVMWNARIMPLRFLDAFGYGSTADAISAIEYANAMGADVINSSWGSGGFSQALKDIIDVSPAVVACAAGNGGSDGIGDNNDSIPFYPASYTSSNIIAVAATNRNDNLASFSNFGLISVDVGAPGVSIYSTVPGRDEVFFDDMTNLDNWIAQTPWGLSSTYFSAPSSVADSPAGNYQNNSYTTLTLSGPLDLTGYFVTIMEYQLRADVEWGYDLFCIEASTDGITWDFVNCYFGSTDGAFVFIDEDLKAYDNQGSVLLRFSLITDYSVTDDGVYIDDVRITAMGSTYNGSEYAYFSGTSMAAPHVSGVAGLIKAFNPGLTNIEIKNIILNNIDPISSLSGKVLTGGRINAFNALSASCSNLPVRNLNTLSQFPTLQAAYDAAVNGNTIQLQMRVFPETLSFNQGKSVTIMGGYDCEYLNNPGVTTIYGNMTISVGILTIQSGTVEIQ